MRKALLAVLLVAAISCSPESRKPNDNVVHNVEKIMHSIPDFDIEFPETGFEVEKTETRDPNFDNVLITKWIVQGKDDKDPFIYFVAHNVIPKKLMQLEREDSSSIDSAFQAMLTSPTLKIGGTDFNFRRITYDGHQGLETTCKAFNGGGIIESRVYRIENDLFVIGAGGRNISLSEIDKFLGSFKIKK